MGAIVSLSPHKLLFISGEEVKHKTLNWKHTSAQIKHNLLTPFSPENFEGGSEMYLKKMIAYIIA